MGRCVDDVATLFNVIKACDADDPYSVQNIPSNFQPPIANFRIGIPDNYFFTDLHPETEAAYRAAIRTFNDLGTELHQIVLPGFEASEKASAKILLAEAAAYHFEHIEQHADQIGVDVLTRFKWGLDVTGVEYALARRTQVEWRHKIEHLFESIDTLVLPATPFPATRIDDSDPVALSRGNLTRFTRMFNLTGHPAIVLPCGRTADGLSIGLQIVGAHWQEDKIIQMARAYEAAWGKIGIAEC
jgi:aspartyl-tRNA(Asn)/glutamyl-tRNA(Gln) amidotransferase subunit A